MLEAVLIAVPGGTYTDRASDASLRPLGPGRRALHSAVGPTAGSDARVLTSRRNGARADIDRHGSGRSIEGRGPWVHP
jgi:hypothetical protein